MSILRCTLFIAAVYVVTGLPSIANAQSKSCWGQASAVFARMGLMGEHAAQQGEPRLGLANLARALFDAGVISEPTIAALGAYVADLQGLSVDACTTDEAAIVTAENTAANNAACWGQASAVFAQMGTLGEHASQQPNPRLGLRNLARALYEAGVIPDDSMSSLGAFVAAELGLEIQACS